MADVIVSVADIPRDSVDGFEYFVALVVEDTALQDLKDAIDAINNPL